MIKDFTSLKKGKYSGETLTKYRWTDDIKTFTQVGVTGDLLYLKQIFQTEGKRLLWACLAIKLQQGRHFEGEEGKATHNAVNIGK